MKGGLVDMLPTFIGWIIGSALVHTASSLISGQQFAIGSFLDFNIGLACGMFVVPWLLKLKRESER